MGSLTAGTGLAVAGVVAVLVLLCAGIGISAWLRMRRIDRMDTTREPATPTPARPGPSPTPAPPDDPPPDPEYQGPGDWDGGPADPPEFRIQSE